MECLVPLIYLVLPLAVTTYIYIPSSKAGYPSSIPFPPPFFDLLPCIFFIGAEDPLPRPERWDSCQWNNSFSVTKGYIILDPILRKSQLQEPFPHIQYLKKSILWYSESMLKDCMAPRKTKREGHSKRSSLASSRAMRGKPAALTTLRASDPTHIPG